jgi:hypothetical protein
MLCIRTPRVLTQVPTRSIFLSFGLTQILVRYPGSRVIHFMIMLPSAIAGTSIFRRRRTKFTWLQLSMISESRESVFSFSSRQRVRSPGVYSSPRMHSRAGSRASVFPISTQTCRCQRAEQRRTRYLQPYFWNLLRVFLFQNNFTPCIIACLAVWATIQGLSYVRLIPVDPIRNQ